MSGSDEVYAQPIPGSSGPGVNGGWGMAEGEGQRGGREGSEWGNEKGFEGGGSRVRRLTW